MQRACDTSVRLCSPILPSQCHTSYSVYDHYLVSSSHQKW